MSPLTDDAPLRLDRPGLVQGVREVLDRAGFDEAGIARGSAARARWPGWASAPWTGLD